MNFRTSLSKYNGFFNRTYDFKNLKELLAKASPLRSGDELAGVAAETAEERIAAQMVLSETPLSYFLEEEIIPYDKDNVTRLIFDGHDYESFKPLSSMNVAEFREWLLSEETGKVELSSVYKGITPEMAAAVSKIMSLQDLILAASKCENITSFRNTIGVQGNFSSRLQPNHPTDDVRGVASSILDGLFYGIGDAVIGINPATDNVKNVTDLLILLDKLIRKHDIPAQSCVLTHVTTTLEAMKMGAPVDLVFQSIGGTQRTNDSFGFEIEMLEEARAMALDLKRAFGDNVMYFETGQGSSLSADAHWGVDQQTCECRAYALARSFDPLLVNSVVGFIGPEYLFNGKQILRAGLEDHFCGKIMGLPMGCDVCYTNHADADQDDMDALLTLLANAGCTFVMGVPGADDIMLNYQSTSFHDIAYVRRVLKKGPAPEFQDWLEKMGICGSNFELLQPAESNPLLLSWNKEVDV